MFVQRNFNDYLVLRGSEIPQVKVIIVPSEEHPSGVGEDAVPAILAATCNAVSKAVGKRLRALSLRFF